MCGDSAESVTAVCLFGVHGQIAASHQEFTAVHLLVLHATSSELIVCLACLGTLTGSRRLDRDTALPQLAIFYVCSAPLVVASVHVHVT
jgi:hypothetical protein